jgi:hypothetical protein
MEELDVSCSDYPVREGYYDSEFEELIKIEYVDFLSIFKVKKKSDTKIYAVKKIRLITGDSKKCDNHGDYSQRS